MNRPRLSLRLAMLLVAVVALAVWLPLENRRLDRFRLGYKDRALRYAREPGKAKQDALRSRADWVALIEGIDREERAQKGWSRAPRPYSPDKARGMIAHFEKLRAKYERAARYPWLPVAPDPPEPR